MTRSLIITTTLILLAGFISFFLITARSTFRDGSPDDRLITTMQYLAWDAQTVMDETGELPVSITGLLKVLNRPALDETDIDVSYVRLGDSNIQLCGDFKEQSSGQTTAQPYFDVGVHLRPELTAPRPKPGLHCFDIELVRTASDKRVDALLYRELDAAATAIECAYWATNKLPGTLATAKKLSLQKRDTSACSNVREFLGQSNQSFEYSAIDETTTRLCAKFRSSYVESGEQLRLFDPRGDSRFFELAQERPDSGDFCYSIKMLRPDSTAAVPTFAWPEPPSYAESSNKRPNDIAKDKRAIGEVVNILRLVRCAFSMGEATPKTINEAIQTIASHPQIARRYSCGWAPSYFGDYGNFPDATYYPGENGEVRVCAQFLNSWKRPLSLNYSARAAAQWPTSLPELQRSIKEPGRQCYSVELTAVGSGL